MTAHPPRESQDRVWLAGLRELHTVSRRDALCPAGSRQTLTFPPVESTNRAWGRFSTISPNAVTVLHSGRLGVLKTLQAVDKSGLESMAWHSARN